MSAIAVDARDEQVSALRRLRQCAGRSGIANSRT